MRSSGWFRRLDFRQLRGVILPGPAHVPGPMVAAGGFSAAFVMSRSLEVDYEGGVLDNTVRQPLELPAHNIAGQTAAALQDKQQP